MASRTYLRLLGFSLFLWFVGLTSALLPAAGAAPRPTIPSQLSQTGIFADLRTLTPSAGVVPYEVNVPYWSDGALKRRWIALPGTGSSKDPSVDRIITKPGLPWTFPAGTVFVQHFELPDRLAASGIRRLETRVIVRAKEGGVYGVTYRWNAQGTEAFLLHDEQTESLTLQQADGTTTTQEWDYPSPDQCLICHNQAAGGVLGVSYRQLERKVRYAAGSGSVNQIEAWNSAGMLSKSLDEPEPLAPWNLIRIPAGLPLPFWNIRRAGRLPPTQDSSASIESRARAYLDANCSYCHAPGIVAADWDARFTTPLSNQGIVGGHVRNPRGGISDIVSAGSPERSLLYVRLTTSDPSLRMPPLGRSTVDPEAAQLLSGWIKSLASKQ